MGAFRPGSPSVASSASGVTTLGGISLHSASGLAQPIRVGNTTYDLAKAQAWLTDNGCRHLCAQALLAGGVRDKKMRERLEKTVCEHWGKGGHTTGGNKHVLPDGKPQFRPGDFATN